MIALLITLTIIKVVVAGLVGGTADIPQQFEQARAFLAGRDLLDPQQTGSNPSFFLLGHYLLASGCLLLAEATRLPFSWMIKLPAIVSDLGVACLLNTMPRGGGRVALLYLLNPVTLLLSVYHGQLHTVAMAGALLAVWFAQRRQFRMSALMLVLAASVRQHYAILIVPLMRKAGHSGVRLFVVFLFVMLGVNSSFLGSHHPERLFAPTWTYGSWGYTIPLLQGPRVLEVLGVRGFASLVEPLNRSLQAFGAVVYWLWALVFAGWAWRRPRVDLWRATLFFLVGLVSVSPGFGVQWLVWVVPWWLIVHVQGALRYSALAGAFLIGSYWQAGLNAKYGLDSITAHVDRLTTPDLIGLLLVGTLGVLTWFYCARTAWRLRHG